mmetsp:Transcript_12610/g.22590  ORF Transcript_12610/g.22590 Transcript_12610/m.22590 type:complete len:805 (-) Transcript_12610:21-2435(-)
MVEFGKRLQEECAQHDADWHWHCIDYGALKHIIKKEKKTISGDDSEDESAVVVAVAAGDALYHGGLLESSPSLHLQFQYALDREIEKAVLYVLREQGTIASELDHLAVRRAKFVDHMFTFLRRGDNYNEPSAIVVSSGSQKDARIRAALNELREMHEGYAMAALSVLQFVAFVDLNVTAVRKILKKHDKITKRKLSHSYLSAYNSQDVDSHLDQLYNDGGLSSLVVSLRRAFKELHHVELELMDMMQTGEGVNQQKHRRIQSMPASRIRSGSFFELQQTIEAPPTPTPVANGENALVTTHKEPLLQMIQMSRDRLRRNTQYVDIVAAQALFFAEADDEEVSSTSSEMTRSQRISSFLNLLSTFLYMTNYYIVAPTCGQYSARVGSTESMAGIVIGMTPNAALVATVLYGWWSNHSYKSALVFAAFCSFLGNIAYALALKYDSIELIMIGRALNGFGSARSINRRFIADTFSKRDRTAASAAFVTAGALGMACGPALAAIFSQLSYSLDGKLWSEETAPGWIMMCLWSLFLIALVIFFEEPDRSHIFGKKPMLELTTTKNGENKYLLATDAHQSSASLESKNHESSLWNNVPVMMTLLVYFVLKLVLECLMSSSPTLTMYYFGWTSRSSGFFLAFLGLLMFPANMIVARLSHRFEDREIIYSCLVVILCSILGIISYLPGKYSVVQYMAFGICIFIATNALEGPNMSLLSKSIPRSWAKGIFNTGFLATEAGTLARSVGDVWITLASHVAGVSGVLNAIFVPMIGLVAVCVVLMRRNYDQMVEDDDDDVKSKNSNNSDQELSTKS